MVVANFDCLRTVFLPLSSGVMQVVLDQDWTEWIQLDSWSLEEVDSCIEQLLPIDRQKGFSFQDKTFTRISTAKIRGTNRIVMLVSQQHAITDAWSGELVMDALLAALSQKPMAVAAPFGLHVADVLGRDVDEVARFWKEKLSNVNPVAFPLVDTRTPMKQVTVTGTFALDIKQLESLQQSKGATLASISKACWALLLYRYQRTPHVVFGNISNGREGAVEGIA
ncbi:hypothetical protein HDU91_000510, partial [Kappamyces sp. JEL0680]